MQRALPGVEPRRGERPAGQWCVGAFAALAIGLGAFGSGAFSPVALGDESQAAAGEACAQVGSWRSPETGAVLAADSLFASLVERPVVLLGEVHDDWEHHRWQLHTLAALYSRKPNLVIGFEMFPRRVQPALDRWVRGELAVEEFLDESAWREVWGFDAELYLPLFHFARQNRLPMVALNVDRDLISRVGDEGWDAVPAEERAGLSDPAPASRGYREFLARVFAVHLPESDEDRLEPSEAAEGGDLDLDSVLAREDFGRFVQSQQTWDRAMAEALAEAHSQNPEALVVGVIGRGHIDYGYGVPHQLADLGVDGTANLVPMTASQACADVSPELADALFVVEKLDGAEANSVKPRLGVMIETAEDGVRIMSVLADSVAEATELKTGDIVVSAAGFPVAEVSDLIEIVQRQAPGTWLPLEVKRDGEGLEFVARFPREFDRVP